MIAIGVNDSTTASQPSSIEISQDSGRQIRSKRNTLQRDTINEAANTSSTWQPQQQQQQHERVSISGNTTVLLNLRFVSFLITILKYIVSVDTAFFFLDKMVTGIKSMSTII